MISILLSIILLITTHPQTLSSDIKQPTLKAQLHILETDTKAISKTIVLDYPLINFQSSLQLFMRRGKVNDIYNKSQYSDIIPGCSLYPTDLSLHHHNSFDLEGFPLAYTILSHPLNKSKLAQLYIINANQQMLQFQLVGQAKGIENKQLKLMRINSLKNKLNLINLNSQEPSPQTMNMLTLNGQLLIVTSHTLYLKKQTDYVEVSGYEGNDSINLVQIGVYRQEKEQIWVALNNGIKVYEFIQEAKVKLVDNVSSQLPQLMMDVIHEGNIFYILSPKTLHMRSLQSYPEIKSQMQLPSTCSKMKNYLSTFHLLCQTDNRQYIAQLYVMVDKAYVNRYYTDNDIPGIRNVRKLGESKMILLGDDEVLLQGYGINRNILMDYGREQPHVRYWFYKGLDVLTFDQITTKRNTHILAIFTDQIEFLTIEQNPPQLYCQVEEQSIGDIFSFLAVFNQTYCAFAPPQKQAVEGHLQSLCQIYYPLEVTNIGRLIERKTGNLIIAAIILAIVLLALFLGGCLIRRVRAFDFQRWRVGKALSKLKNKLKNKEMKQL